MCNRYAVEASPSQQSIHFQSTVMDSTLESVAQLVYPDSRAAVVTFQSGQRIIEAMRWGFPPPPSASDLVTNVRNLRSSFWQEWLQSGHRCLIPFTRFCEYSDQPDAETGRKRPCWFALDDTTPLFAFAGLWRPWHGMRGTSRNKVEGTHKVFAILTTAPNAVVKPVHSKAMPVIVKPEDYTLWLEGKTDEALSLQKPWPDNGLILLPNQSPPQPRQASLF